MPSTSRVLSSLLATSHLAIGLLSLLVPIWTAINIFGLEPGRPVPIATRIGGSRDTLLGGWLLFSSSSNERKKLIAVIALADAIDMISALTCYAEGNLPLHTARAAATASGTLAVLEFATWLCT